jgi:WD40 repeat protein
VWDVETGRELHALKGTVSEWTPVFAPDGRRVMTLDATDDQQWEMGNRVIKARVWEVQTGREVLTLQVDEGMFSAVYSPDGSKLVTSGTVPRIWDALSGKELHALRHSHWTPAVRFSPDGRHVATGSDDGTTRVWDVDTGKVIHVLRGHTLSVQSVAFSGDGRRAVSSSDDGTVRVWDVLSGKSSGSSRGTPATSGRRPSPRTAGGWWRRVSP